MTVPSEVYEKLERYSDFSNEDNIDLFLDTVDEIVGYRDPDSIEVFLQYFDDNSDYSWVFESLGGAIEQFNKEIYIEKLLKGLPSLIEKSPLWADNLFNKIFNDQDYLKCFKEKINLATKNSLLRLFNVMEKESSHHQGLIKELHKKLSISEF